MPDFATALARFRRRAVRAAKTTPAAAAGERRKYLEALATDFDRECVEYDRQQQFEREVRRSIADAVAAGSRA